MRKFQNNPESIIAFKEYLEKQYQISSFEEYRAISTMDSQDSIIRNFGLDNQIIGIYTISQNENSSYLDRFGKIVSLSFDRKPIWEKNQNIIFDYTEKGLKNYNPEYAKFEIAERIYIFR